MTVQQWLWDVPIRQDAWLGVPYFSCQDGDFFERLVDYQGRLLLGKLAYQKVLEDKRFAPVFQPTFSEQAFDGYVGIVKRCHLYTDAFRVKALVNEYHAIMLTFSETMVS